MNVASHTQTMRDASIGHSHNVRDITNGARLSSHGLGWSALNFEQHESRPGVRHLPRGSRHHLLLIGMSNGRVVREAQGKRTEHELTPGFVEVIPAGTPVRWSWQTRIGFCVLMLEPAFVQQVALQSFGLAADEYRVKLSERRNDNGINTIAGVLAREALSRNAGGRVYADSLANILAVHLLRHYTQHADGVALPDSERAQQDSVKSVPQQPREGNSQPRAVAQAVRLIEENYSQDLALSKIAAAVHVSPFHLSRLFKRTLGISPHQYLIRVRVDSARSMLSGGSRHRPLSEVAAAVGFSDQSHLTRHVKRITGLTPRQLRA